MVRLAEACLAHAEQKQSGVFAGLAQLALSRAYSVTRGLSDAEAAAGRALQLLQGTPPLQLGVYAQLIQLRLESGDLDSARQVTAEGMSKLQALEGRGWMDLALRLKAVEVAFASERTDEGRAALSSALALLRARTDQLPDAQLRAGYLTNLPENAQLLALGREHLPDVMEPFDHWMAPSGTEES